MVPTASPEKPLLPPKGSSFPHGGHDEKGNVDLDPLIKECGGGSDVSYDSTIESYADLNETSEGGPGSARNRCITRGSDGPAPADERRDGVFNVR